MPTSRRPHLLLLTALVGLALLLVLPTLSVPLPASAQAPQLAWRFEFLRQWSKTPPPGIFNSPYGMAFDESGNLYVVDYYNHRVQVLDREGQAVRTLGRLGNGPGGFYLPLRVAVDSQGIIYVTDAGNNRVARFNRDGTPLPSWDGFEHPQGISIGSDGSVYVSDNLGEYPNYRGRIQQLSPDGLSRRTVVEASSGFRSLKVKREGGTDVIYVLSATGPFGGTVLKYSPVGGAPLAQWSDLNLQTPLDLEVDSQGGLYVVDQYANEVVVRVWRDRQQVTERWSGFLSPRGIVLGPDNLLYVSDGEGGNFGHEAPRITDQRIQRFTLQGERVLPVWGSDEGHAPGQLVNPDHIAWDPRGYVWVHNNADGRFMQFTPEGELVHESLRSASLKSITSLTLDADGNLLVGRLCQIYKLSPTGEVLAAYEGQTEPLCPRGIDLDGTGNMYVADLTNHRVLKLDRQGQRQKVYGGSETLSEPMSVVLDERHDRLYVLDQRRVDLEGRTWLSTQIQVFKVSDGTLQDTWIVPNIDPARPFDDTLIVHLEVDQAGYVYASDAEVQTVWKLEPVKGEPIARIEPGGYGAGPGQFDQLAGINGFTVDPNGNLYTVEFMFNWRVQVFAQVNTPMTPTIPVTTTPTATPSATATATPSPLPSATHTLTATVTPTPSEAGSATATVTVTTQPTTAIPSPAPSATPTTVNTVAATPTMMPPPPTDTPTPTATATRPPLARDYLLFVPYLLR